MDLAGRDISRIIGQSLLLGRVGTHFILGRDNKQKSQPVTPYKEQTVHSKATHTLLSASNLLAPNSNSRMNNLFSQSDRHITNSSPFSSVTTKNGYWWAAFALIATFWFFQPELFLLNVSPMAGDLWSNKDGVVSWMAFMPSLREFRFELFEHGNILWSNLRGMGQPMLGNGVQGAPLFPLSLALMWLPDQIFWSVMPMARIMLIGLMMFLIARNVFKLPWAAALVFAVLAGYNLNIFRWINHPWTNGALAGVWYFYFLVRVSLPRDLSVTRQRWHAAGLVVGIIGMVTNGFPEASALFAIIILFIYIAVMMAEFSNLKTHFWLSCQRLFLLHFVGFGLSAIQIIALLEYIEYTGAMDLRKGYISGAWKSEDAYPYTLSQLSLFWKTEAQRRYISFTVGTVGGYLALQGLFALLFDARRLGRLASAVGVGFLLTMLLFAVKGFGLSPAVEWVFSKTPVLDVSHFPLYFSPLFYFGSAYFAALGLASYYLAPRESRAYHLARAFWALATLALIVRAIEGAAEIFSNMQPRGFWINQLHGESFDFLWVLLIIAGGLIAFHLMHAIRIKPLIRLLPYKFIAILGSVLAVTGVSLEQRHTVQAKFTSTQNRILFRSPEELAAVEDAVKNSGFPRHELRARDESGEYLQSGIATIDNGVSAMLPADLRTVRIALYNAPYGGYVALRNQLLPWSGWLTSNNLTAVHSTPFSQPDWTAYQTSELLSPSLPYKETEFVLKQQNPLYFFSHTDSFSKPGATIIWLKFNDGQTIQWLKANTGSQNAKMVGDKIQTRTLWRVRQPLRALEGRTYTVTVRVVDELSKTYQDLAPMPLSIEQLSTDLQYSPEDDRLLVEFDEKARSIFFENNALPRAYIASSCKENATPSETVTLFKTGREMMAGKVAINQAFTGVCENYQNELKRVPILTDRGSELSFAPIMGPALLYLNDSYYPGWQATDRNSGERFEIMRANQAMRAVYLPQAKEYQLEMNYTPSWLKWVYIITLLSLAVFVWLLTKIKRDSRYREH